MKKIKDILVVMFALISLVCLAGGLIHGAWHLFLLSVMSIVASLTLLGKDDIGSVG